MREVGTPASAELADKPPLALREAVQESGLLMHCKGAFIACSTGNASQDAVRKLVVELLQVGAACRVIVSHYGQSGMSGQQCMSC